MRRAARILVVVITAVVAVALLVAMAARTPWAKDRLRTIAVTQASRYLNGDISVGRLGGSIFHDVVLSDVRFVQNGEPVLEARTLTIDYNLMTLIRQGLTFD